MTFRRVRGDAFERTIKVSTDLSARLGIDLVSAVRQVGRAINDPIQGLTLLRRSGIQFSESQKNLIERLVETGQAGRAQNLILTELEARYKGAAAAARNTLGGALAGLQNAFGDLFEGTVAGTSAAVDSINGISKALTDPELKEGIDTLIAGMAKLLQLSVSALGTISKGVKRAGEGLAKRLSGSDEPVERLREQLNELTMRRQKIIERNRRQDARFSLFPDSEIFTAKRKKELSDLEEKINSVNVQLLEYARLSSVAPKAGAVSKSNAKDQEIFDVQEVEEVRTTARRKELTATQQFYAELNDLTKTSTEQQLTRYHQLIEAINELERAQTITATTAQDRRAEALDELLPEFDLDKIRGLKKDVKVEMNELAEFTKGVWQGVGQSIQSTLSDALYEWKFSFRSLVDITRRALADITSAIITSGISDALKSQLGGSGSSGYLGALFSLFGGSAGADSAMAFYHGTAASGGRFSGPTLVGEDGPELVTGTGRVYNKRQMAFGGMGSVAFSPVTNITVVERDNPERTKREIFEAVAIQNAQQQSEFIRTLQRSGVELKG